VVIVEEEWSGHAIRSDLRGTKSRERIGNGRGWLNDGTGSISMEHKMRTCKA
jgi:hypothetical protein